MKRLIVESEKYKGFFEITGYSNYAISREGVVINKQSGVELVGSTNPAGYVNFRLKGDDGYTLTWGRHRLLCFVFKFRPDYKELYVNHENGIKGFDVLDNLEWETPKGNVEHAGRIGITNKCTPVSVRDVDTGVVVDYPSATSCAGQLGLTKDAVLYRLRFGEERVFPERKQYRYSSVVDEWKIPADINHSLLQNSNCKSVTVRFLKNNTIMQFGKIEDAAQYLGVSPSVLTEWINKVDYPVFRGFVQVKWSLDLNQFRPVEDMYLECEKSMRNRFVISLHEPSKKIRLYENAVDLAREHGIGKTTLLYRLKGKGKSIFNDYRYLYYSDYIDIYGPIRQ